MKISKWTPNKVSSELSIEAKSEHRNFLTTYGMGLYILV